MAVVLCYRRGLSGEINGRADTAQGSNRSFSPGLGGGDRDAVHGPQPALPCSPSACAAPPALVLAPPCAERVRGQGGGAAVSSLSNHMCFCHKEESQPGSGGSEGRGCGAVVWHVPRPTTEGHSGAGVHVLVTQQLHFIWKPCRPVAVDWGQGGLPGSALFSRGTDAYLSVWRLLILTDDRRGARPGELFFTEGRRTRFTEQYRLTFIFSKKVIFTVKEGTRGAWGAQSLRVCLWLRS